MSEMRVPTINESADREVEELRNRQALTEPAVPDAVPDSFLAHMQYNYPPGTRIEDAAWHAERIWLAARRALAQQGEGT